MKIKAVGCRWPYMILFAQFSFRNLLQQIKGLPLCLRRLRIWLQCRRPGSIPGSGRSPGKGKGYPLQYSCLAIPWTQEPGELQSMGLQRVRHNWKTNNNKISYLLLVIRKNKMTGITYHFPLTIKLKYFLSG